MENPIVVKQVSGFDELFILPDSGKIIPGSVLTALAQEAIGTDVIRPSKVRQLREHLNAMVWDAEYADRVVYAFTGEKLALKYTPSHGEVTIVIK